MDAITADLDRYQRPSELGRLEITMTPVGRFDRGVAEQYAQLGVDRLVLLPWLDIPTERRHEPVPVDDILRTIDTVAASNLADQPRMRW